MSRSGPDAAARTGLRLHVPYMLQMFPSRWTARWILPDSCSAPFRKRPTRSECRTSQNTQISARSRWMWAWQAGRAEHRTERLMERHACSTSLQFCSVMTHLARWWRWSLWTVTRRWKRLERGWGRCGTTPLWVETLQDRRPGETSPSVLRWVPGAGARLGPAGRRWLGVSEMQRASSGGGFPLCDWSPVRSASVTAPSVGPIRGAALAGLIGSGRSAEPEGNQGLKTGGGRQVKGSRSLSVCCSREERRSADPGW